MRLLMGYARGKNQIEIVDVIVSGVKILKGNCLHD